MQSQDKIESPSLTEDRSPVPGSANGSCEPPESSSSRRPPESAGAVPLAAPGARGSVHPSKSWAERRKEARERNLKAAQGCGLRTTRAERIRRELHAIEANRDEPEPTHDREGDIRAETEAYEAEIRNEVLDDVAADDWQDYAEPDDLYGPEVE